MLPAADRATSTQPRVPPPSGEPSITTQAQVLIARHQQGNRIDVAGVGRDVAAIRAGGEPTRADALRDAIAPRLSPVDQGRFLASTQPPAGPNRGEVIADLAQIGLDVAGIVDPTPISDGSNAVISIFRGDFSGAAISAVGIIPYVGDAAKLGKLGRWAETVANAATLAKTDARFAELARPALERIKGALDKVDVDSLPLPGFAKESLGRMKRGVDEALTPAVRAVDAIPVQRFTDAAAFNRAANNAAPSTRYEFGNYSYTTDAVGRPTTAEGRISLTPTGRNDPGLQAQIGHEGRPTDVGFHLIGDRFGGQTNRLNVVPGNGERIPGDPVANLNQGAYGSFEKRMAQIASDPSRQVDVRIEARYADTNATTRPDSFAASYRVNGGRWITQSFVNK